VAVARARAGRGAPAPARSRLHNSRSRFLSAVAGACPFASIFSRNRQYVYYFECTSEQPRGRDEGRFRCMGHASRDGSWWWHRTGELLAERGIAKRGAPLAEAAARRVSRRVREDLGWPRNVVAVGSIDGE